LISLKCRGAPARHRGPVRHRVPVRHRAAWRAPAHAARGV